MLNTKIILVEDEVAVRFGLEEVLRREGYSVESVDNGRDAIAKISTTVYDLALLDLLLLEGSGLEVLAAIKEKSPTTIAIILTAHASVDSAVEALRNGAYDYLIKPIDNETLRERVRNGLAKRQELIELQDTSRTLRNIRSLLQDGSPSSPLQVIPFHPMDQLPETPAPHVNGDNGLLRHGQLIIDRQRYTVEFDSKPVSFSPTEFQLLVILMRESPKVVDPKTLAAEALDYQIDESEARKIISYHIYRMRRKLQEAAGDREIIQTVRGVGYTIS